VIFVLALVWLAAIGLPLFALFGAASLGLFLDAPGGFWEALATDVFGAKLGDSPSLMTLPLLLFTGCLLAESAAPQRLLELARGWLGWMPRAFAIASWFGCALLTTFSTGTAVAAVAVLLLPAVVRLHGRANELEARAQAAAHEASGVTRRTFVASEAWRALIAAKWELALPVVLIGSQLLGSLRWHEAAALAGLYALLIEGAVHRDVELGRALPRVAGDTVTIAGVALAVVITAIGLNAWLLQADVQARWLTWMDASLPSPIAFVLLINALLVAASVTTSVYTALLIIVPLAMPLADHYQVDPYRLAIVFLLNAELGRFIWPAREQAPPQLPASPLVQPVHSE
jgi:TRAP-type C4-dicarboxylate transport system permease large subunit